MKIGAITIGQSPRVDIIPDIKPLLPGVDIIERGALDNLDQQALNQFASSPCGATLATRLRDGKQIVIGEEDVLPLLCEGIKGLEQDGAELVLVLCTGTFPPLQATVPLLYPERILQGVVQAVFWGETLGVVTPHPKQISNQLERWSKHVPGRILVEAASPYEGNVEKAIEGAATALKEGGATMIALDCLGYSTAMRCLTQQVAGVPTLLARTTLARVAAEILGLSSCVLTTGTKD